MANANYDELLTTTLANHAPKMVDNVFSARPLFHFLKRRDQIKLISGGHKIVRPIIIAENDSAASYSDYDTISGQTNEFFSAAEYPWKQYAAGVKISGIEEAKNSGPEEILDLLDGRVMVTEQTIIEKLDEMLITSDGTGNSNKDWAGLETLVAQNASSVGGIDPSTNSYWESYIEATSEALGLAKLSTSYNSVSVGNDQPTFGLTTQVLYEAYEALLQPQLRFSDSTTADAGFQNLMYKGAPVVYDEYVPSGYWYWLNTRYLELVGHKDNWFRTTPFVKPSEKDARYAQIILYGGLVVTNRARQGVLTDKTA